MTNGGDDLGHMVTWAWCMVLGLAHQHDQRHHADTTSLVPYTDNNNVKHSDLIKYEEIGLHQTCLARHNVISSFAVLSSYH